MKRFSIKYALLLISGLLLITLSSCGEPETDSEGVVEDTIVAPQKIGACDSPNSLGIDCICLQALLDQEENAKMHLLFGKLAAHTDESLVDADIAMSQQDIDALMRVTVAVEDTCKAAM